LRRWIEEDHAGLLLEQRFIEAARQWAASGRHESELYRGPRLADVAERAANTADDTAGTLPATAAEFLDAALAHQRETEARERRGGHRLRLLAAVLAGLLVISLTATGIAVYTRGKLVTEADAGRSSELAGTALSLRSATRRATGAGGIPDLPHP
jgi:hypothetical protein